MKTITLTDEQHALLIETLADVLFDIRDCQQDDGLSEEDSEELDDQEAAILNLLEAL
jgi:hypothetical protein